MRKGGKSVLDEAMGVLLFGLGILLILALLTYNPADVPSWLFFSHTSAFNQKAINLVGPAGAIVAGFLYFLFGAGAWILAALLLWFGVAKMMLRKFLLRERVGWCLLLILSGASLAHLQRWFFQNWKDEFVVEGPGGWFGLWIGERAFGNTLGFWGSFILLGTLYVASLILALGFHPIRFFKDTAKHILSAIRNARERRLQRMSDAERIRTQQLELEKQALQIEKKLKRSAPKREPSPPPEEILVDEDEESFPEPKIIDASIPAPSPKRPPVSIKKSPTRPAGLQEIHLENYTLPPLDLLDPPDIPERQPAALDELKANQEVILETLKQFGIDAKPGDITRGPTITRYEIYPGKAVRVDRITSLERDIARATRAERINILAPIPGKDTVGIEIANPRKVKVTLRELFETDAWVNSKSRIPLALGKDVYGNTILGDLAQMPHCLVAGTTGSGKSVCINAIIASLLFKFSPEELRFIMIDPKVVEMQIYNTLPHLVTPVVTDPKKVLLALRWVIDEMELRYKIFARCGVRNITGFNARPKPRSQAELDAEAEEQAGDDDASEPAGEAAQDLEPEPDTSEPLPRMRVPRDDDLIIPEHMPYIVVVVDELADLMQTAPADVESAIARITQMARAAGIHMIVATQTPRAQVVTGIIKANIPSRIAFQTASPLDSRVILDENGAEKLLGQGDMLYLPPGTSRLSRAQGVLVTDEEIHRIVAFCSSHAKPQFEPGIHEKLTANTPPEEEISEEDEELVEKCLEIIRQERKASTSMLQRRLRLGYTRAARIVDILETRGILGPKDGAKDREIMVDLDTMP